MESRTCMNEACGASTSIEWRKGWVLRSGEFAVLCDKCGFAFEQLLFCDEFHPKDSGWRECTSCSKRLHCGCIASRALIELLDSGGVSCINCAKRLELDLVAGDEKPNGFSTLKTDNASDLQSASLDNQLGGSVDKLKLMQLANSLEGVGLRHLLQFRNDDPDRSFGKMKMEEATKPDVSKIIIGAKDIYDSLAHTNLSITLGESRVNSNSFPSAFTDEKEHSKTSSFVQQGNRSRHLLPKPPKLALATGSEANASIPQVCVARPSAEGRGRNQLLPRYWPRITDQELQQISGDSNSTIVPLFEKVLSASDAGRIGRLVLPKACAEAYFPPISQPEGLPLRVQDIKGKEWVFQFRFWPNNNSRMYVLEGVTPCIQSMQLQAGDTVTFSRMDPEGKLVMGFRKASSSAAMQDAQPSAIPNDVHSRESFFSGVFENLSILSGYPGVLQSLKGSTDPHLNALSKHLNSTPGDISRLQSEKQDETRESLLLQSMLAPERKRSRNIGSKCKRLLIDRLDALELKLTWEEAQDMLHPPPTVMPSIVTIEDHVFEEYEDSPVFGKRSIFVVHTTGGQEQWVQCDSCSKWRRLPIDVLLPPKWTCMDNAWDHSRCSCSVPDELTPRELENLLRLHKDFKKRRIAASERPGLELEPSGIDAMSNAAILGENMGDPGTASVATTTKHPRHRPGCSCIVCIQPPSGKGKHKPTCTCNVCMTVKRRFKTLMIRKKKRQSEREAEFVQRNPPTCGSKEEAEVDSSSKHVSSHFDPSENEARSANELESKSQSNNMSGKLAGASKSEIDLNCHPSREEMQIGLNRVSMMKLLQVASLPLETYLKQNGLTSLMSEQQEASPASPGLPTQATGESDGWGNEFAAETRERENGGEENCEATSDKIPDDLQ